MPSSRAQAVAFDRKATAAETAFRRAAIELFGAEREEIVNFIVAAAVRGDSFVQAALRLIEENYNGDGEYHRRWVEAYAELSTNMSRIGGAELMAQSGISFGLVNPEVIDAAVRRADKLADYVGKTTADRVSEAVGEALANGDTDLADVIRNEAFDDDITLARAEMIARTESIGALNEGEYTSALASGVFVEKEWMTQGDDKVRESHAALDGVRIPIEDEFDNGLMFPGDQNGDAEEVINCRCTLLYHDSAGGTESGGDSEE